MILVMPLPQMLKQTTMTIAETAISQLAEQLVIAELERIRPMEMMMGPVTIGGKKRMTLLTPKALNSADRITYISPAQGNAETGIHQKIIIVDGLTGSIYTDGADGVVAADEGEGRAEECWNLSAGDEVEQ